MFKRILILFFSVLMLNGCVRATNDAQNPENESVGGSNTGMGTPDQTGTGYSTDSTAGQVTERAAEKPTDDERERADQTKNNNKND